MSRWTISRWFSLTARRSTTAAWFDTGAGKPRVQVKATQDGAWETVGETEGIPCHHCTNAAGLKGGERLHLRAGESDQGVGHPHHRQTCVRGQSAQNFASCAKLQAFERQR